ncbi:MAG: hypothetical protein H6Q19_852 [Bacteroidetes bacterium]|nr:hypothetical protein [Bacteroidota bacterium]
MEILKNIAFLINYMDKITVFLHVASSKKSQVY